uniref:BAF250_C domain-containing protein n=1 Tax=Ascaris lumbricoides TaxID=6252 RepID=A0A0M3HLU5_ASCLU
MRALEQVPTLLLSGAAVNRLVKSERQQTSQALTFMRTRFHLNGIGSDMKQHLLVINALLTRINK